MKQLLKPLKLWKARMMQRRTPLHIEFILTDHCNLNCKGCTHFSPVAPAEFASFSRLCESMERLGRLVKNETELDSIYLIGGEPLLYPQLNDAIAAARKAFPLTKIKLFTNGLLLPSMDGDFWKACRNAGVIIVLTRYPINFDYDAAEKLTEKHGVAVETFGDRTKPGTFFRFGLDPDGRHNPAHTHAACWNFGCVSVVGNMLYPCSTTACISHLNSAFNTSFKISEADYLDVDRIESLAEIRKFRNKPIPFCRYCNTRYPVVDYALSRRNSSEWINNGNSSD